MTRLAIFAHWHSHDRPTAGTLRYLRELRSCVDSLWLVSTSPIASGALDGLVDRVHVVDNLGRDFAMWASVLEDALSADIDELVLANSSMVFVGGLPRLFERMHRADVDFWGVTRAPLPLPHLQSYWLVFRRACLRHPAFLRFWRSVLPHADRTATIAAYEVTLTRWLEQNGLRSSEAFPSEVLLANVRWPRPIKSLAARNPSIYLGLELLDAGAPFIKKEIFRPRLGEQLGLRHEIAARVIATRASGVLARHGVDLDSA